jgi:two-component system OmpR family sensor kinase
MDVPLVVTDEAALQKIVMNLVSNAVKFSPDDGEVVVVMEPAQDGGVGIAVLDRGPGISEADRCRIFERFAQATEGTKGSTGGVGLGLYVSATLAEALGAKLEVAAREGGGSIFRLCVPSEPLG